MEKVDLSNLVTATNEKANEILAKVVDERYTTDEAAILAGAFYTLAEAMKELLQDSLEKRGEQALIFRPHSVAIYWGDEDDDEVDYDYDDEDYEEEESN
jgi:hypothetical protein